MLNSKLSNNFIHHFRVGKGWGINGNVPKFRGNISAGKYRNCQRLFTKYSYLDYGDIVFRSLHHP